MNKEELLKNCDFDLDKAIKAWDWLTTEANKKCETISESVFSTIPKLEPTLILKNGMGFPHSNLSNMHFSLEEVFCIALPRLDGTWIGIYPKYKNCSMLPSGKNWGMGKEYSREIDAIYNFTEKDAIENSEWLVKNGSEVAKWCKYYGGYVPSLLTVLAIAHFREAINEIVNHIEEADKIQDNDTIWSSVRSYAGSAWCFFSLSGYIANYSLYGGNLVVPCVPLSDLKNFTPIEVGIEVGFN